MLLHIKTKHTWSISYKFLFYLTIMSNYDLNKIKDTLSLLKYVKINYVYHNCITLIVFFYFSSFVKLKSQCLSFVFAGKFFSPYLLFSIICILSMVLINNYIKQIISAEAN